MEGTPLNDDPDWMSPLLDASTSSVVGVVARLRRSSTGEHHLYREAELDDLWRRIKMEQAEQARVPSVDSSVLLGYYDRLLRATREAHDLAAAGRVQDAATLLTDVLLTDEEGAVLGQAEPGGGPRTC